MKNFVISTTISTILSSIAAISATAAAKELPEDYAERELFCSTWDAQDSDSKWAALEKFSISAETPEGIRFVKSANSNVASSCKKTRKGLECKGHAYAIPDDMLLEDMQAQDAFEFKVTLDYSELRSNLVLGKGKVEGFRRSKDLYCEY